MNAQTGWRWCSKCQGLFNDDNPVKGVCPADHQAHDGDASGKYEVLWDDGATPAQAGWRWCEKCHIMFYSGHTSQGVCPVADHPAPGPTVSGITVAPGFHPPVATILPSHNGKASGKYAILIADPVAGQQGGWRWCHKCQGLFTVEGTAANVCPSGGAHDATGSGHYALPWEVVPPPLPTTRHIHGDISFPDGVAMGGSFDLTLSNDGRIDWSGQFHDSGGDQYDFALGLVLITPNGTPYTFVRSGTVYGTFEPGPADYVWNETKHSDQVSLNWPGIVGASAKWQASSQSFIGKVLDETIGELITEMKKEWPTLVEAAAVALM